MSAEGALKAKDKGNKLFKEGKIAGSVKHYVEAEKLDPKSPVYPSNLSAALYELGAYPEAFLAILRSWALKPESALALKLSTRLAKTLSHGLRNTTIQPSIIEQNIDAIKELEALSPKDSVSSENAQAWKLWRSTRSGMEHHADLAHEDKVRLSKMPIYKSMSDPHAEYFVFGMDDIINLVEDWGPNFKDQLPLRTMDKDQLGQLSFFIGGAADARHAYGTIIGLGKAHSKLSATLKRFFKAHVVINDVHFATVARDLIHCMLVDKLMAPPESLDPVLRLELQATLVYTYIGWVIPPYAHERLVALCKEVETRLNSSPPDLPSWIYVTQASIDPIRRALSFWTEELKITTGGVLKNLVHVSGSQKMERMLSSGIPNMASFNVPAGFNPFSGDREAAERAVNSLNDAQLYELLGGVNQRTRSYAKMRKTPKGYQEFVDLMMKANLDKTLRWGLVLESMWFRDVGAFVPPAKLIDAGRHPGFEYFKDDLIKTQSPHEAKCRQIKKILLISWKPNITVYDGTETGPLKMELDAFSLVVQLAEFNETMDLKLLDQRVKRESPAFAHTMRFFEGFMDNVRELGNRLKVEFVCGEVNTELGKMRLGPGVDGRPQDFPRKFTRMWMSNIPDYTHGTLGTALYMVPSLQENGAVSANCLFNSPVWKSNDEFCFNYTMLLPCDLERYLGVRTIHDKAIMDILTLSPATPTPRPLTSLASREEFQTWLSRLLLSIISPGKGKRRPDLVKVPFTLVAFIQLLIELNRIGYPSHWIADFLQGSINGMLQVDHVTYKGDLPRPVSDMYNRVELHRVRLDPWYAELETILARLRHALPFAIQIPEGWATTPDDIGLYKAQPKPNMVFEKWFGLRQNDTVIAMLFYKSASDLNPRGGVDSFLMSTLASLVDGRERKPEPGQVHVLTMTESVNLSIPEVKWRMSRKLVAKMKKEGWSMVLWRMDCYMRTTDVSPAKTWSSDLLE